MKDFLHTFTHFFKRETVFCIAAAVAILTMFIVHPSMIYISYIDFRVLALLFCLMTVIAGFNSLGVFERILPFLFRFTHNIRQLVFLLILSCFFLSMIVTNDVALITLVPFAIMILNKTTQNNYLIPVIVMQTVAANLGSMCTPIGNPQNLYLYTISNMSIIVFLRIMLPLSLASFLLICFTLFFFPKKKICMDDITLSQNKPFSVKGKCDLYLNLLLLLLCLGTVLHIVDFRITFVTVVITIFITQRRLLLQVDYMLLLTFVAFFIFVGNMKSIPIIYDFLNTVVKNQEINVSILLSQIISNVPCAVLLSGFSHNIRDLLIGTNLGGLGTLIASMASLISFKYYSYTPDCKRLRYLGVFTAVNIIFLVLLYLFNLLFI